MEMEGGMKFLNGNYYARRITGGRPSFHCTTDEDPAFTFLKSSANLCKSLSTDGRKDSGTYCGVPPDTLVEAFYKCENTETYSWVMSFSQAFGLYGSINAVAIIFIVTIAGKIYKDTFEEFEDKKKSKEELDIERHDEMLKKISEILKTANLEGARELETRIADAANPIPANQKKQQVVPVVGDDEVPLSAPPSE